MNNLMIDIETLGNGSNSVIVSISAVMFDLDGTTGEEFHVDIDPQSCIDAGLHVSGSTIMWWMNQDDASRKAVFSPDIVREHISSAIGEFNAFVIANGGSDICAWGRSPRFDLGLIGDAATKCYLPKSWNFRLERDVRTVEAMAPQFKEEEEFTGILHYGIDDAKHQIKYTCKAWNYLTKK